MRPKLREVVQRMVDEGAMSSDDAAQLQRSLSAAAAQDTSAPWYVRLVAAFGAWVSAGLFTWFLALLEVFKSEAFSLVIGGALVAGACVARRKLRHDFAVQGCLAAVVLGEAMVLFGAAELFDLRTTGLALAAIPLNLIVLVAFADVVGRFLAACFAVASVAALAQDARDAWAFQVFAIALAGASATVWEIVPGTNALWRAVRAPAGIALVAGLFGTLTWDIVDHWSDAALVGGATTAGLVVVSAAVATRIFLAHRAPLKTEGYVAALGAIALFGAVGCNTPGILAAALVLALGYHRREVLLVGMACAFLVGFGAHYYYSLELTLLQKSGALAFSGAVALGIRRALGRWSPKVAPA